MLNDFTPAQRQRIAAITADLDPTDDDEIQRFAVAFDAAEWTQLMADVRTHIIERNAAIGVLGATFLRSAGRLGVADAVELESGNVADLRDLVYELLGNDATETVESDPVQRVHGIVELGGRLGILGHTAFTRGFEDVDAELREIADGQR